MEYGRRQRVCVVAQQTAAVESRIGGEVKHILSILLLALVLALILALILALLLFLLLHIIVLQGVRGLRCWSGSRYRRWVLVVQDRIVVELDRAVLAYGVQAEGIVRLVEAGGGHDGGQKVAPRRMQNTQGFVWWAEAEQKPARGTPEALFWVRFGWPRSCSSNWGMPTGDRPMSLHLRTY